MSDRYIRIWGVSEWFRYIVSTNIMHATMTTWSNIDWLYNCKNRGWLNASPCCSALTQLCICAQLHKMWFFTILKPYFHHKNARRVETQLDRRYLCLKLCSIKSKVNSPLKFAKLPVFQFQNSIFPMVFNGCCSLLQRLKSKYQSFTQCMTDRTWNILCCKNKC